MENRFKDTLLTEQMSQLAVVFFHNMREPLRAVHSYSELLAYENQVSPETQHYIDTLKSSSLKMKRVVDATSDYLGLCTAPLKLQPCDLNDVVNGVLAEVSQEVFFHGATVSIYPLPTLEVDPALLSRVFYELFQNSMKFKSNRPLRISLKAEEKRGHVRLILEDNGRGLDPTLHQQAFQLLHQCHEGYEGLGTGLAIAQAIVEKHSGKIEMDGEDGTGMTLFIDLPTA